jgi:hypothetical protein
MLWLDAGHGGAMGRNSPEKQQGGVQCARGLHIVIVFLSLRASFVSFSLGLLYGPERQPQHVLSSSVRQ